MNKERATRGLIFLFDFPRTIRQTEIDDLPPITTYNTTALHDDYRRLQTQDKHYANSEQLCCLCPAPCVTSQQQAQQIRMHLNI